MSLNWLPLVLLFTVTDVQRPIIDFDVVIDALKDEGQWESTGPDLYAFRPKQDNPAWRPYREGRWLYTDYGWTWEGSTPGSWATDHYGFWQTRENKGWFWTPNTQWLPSTVEWVKSGDYYGWRPSRLDRFSNLLESESERYAKPSEWNFVLASKIQQTLTLKDFADDNLAEKLLKNAGPLDHVYKTYREIERPGPPPEILQGPDQKKLSIPIIREMQELGVKPEKISPGDYHAFRPTFHQDNDGLLRRVHLFLNPRAKQQNDASIKETVGEPISDEEKRKQIQKIEDQLERERKFQERLYR
ncbi:MAG: hypothetical protein HC904_07260 [Blastochloris sp.]|nr:hypothetical protein [Blastochloris sp.]